MKPIAVIGMFVEMFIVYYCYSSALEKKYPPLKTFMIYIALQGLNFIKCCFMFDEILLKYITSVLAQFIIIHLLYKDKWLRKVSVCVIYQICVTLGEISAVILAKYVYSADLTKGGDLNAENVLWSLTAYLLIFLFCVIAMMLVRNEKINIENRIVQYVSLYVGVQILIVAMFMMFIYEYKITSFIMIAVILAVMAISFVIASMLYKTMKLLAKKTAEAEFIKKEADIKDKHFFEIKAQYMEYRKLRHDFYNHIKVLDNLDDSEKVKKYIDEIKQKFDSMERVSYCNNPSLDALLSLKNKEADAEKIKTRIAVCDLAGVTVKDYDICSVVANLFDNAIEAAKQTQEKYIDLEINLKADRLFIVVKNSSNEPEKTLKTTKKDKEHHGIGLQSVKETAEKYDGDCVFRYDNGEFVSLVNMVQGE